MDLHLSKVFRRIQGNRQSLFILFGGGGCKNEATVTVTLLTSWNHAAVVGVFTGFRSAVTVQGHVMGMFRESVCGSDIHFPVTYLL